MMGRTFIPVSAVALTALCWALLLVLVFGLAKPAVRSIMRDLAPPRAARCISAESHSMRPACMVGMRAVALNGRRIAGVVCHGDLGCPTVRMLG